MEVEALEERKENTFTVHVLCAKHFQYLMQKTARVSMSSGLPYK